MEDFLKKWNSDPKFKAKIKLLLYTVFILLVTIFAVSNRNDISSNDLLDDYNDEKEINNDNNYMVEILDKYSYIINIDIDGNNYKYTGIKDATKETITKEKDGLTTNYIYENNNYYKEENDNYILTTELEVYDIVDNNYLKLETINKYLEKAVKEDNQYLVYIKDIILGEDSEEYIIITKDTNIIEINYTSLMKKFDDTYNDFLVKIEIEEIE